MAKPNYHHARRQKEIARKARQQEKQQRRGPRDNAGAEEAMPTASDAEGSPVKPSDEPSSAVPRRE